MKSQSGFTLFEVVISMVIISICIFSVALMFQESLRGSVELRFMTQATALAEEKMEEISRLGYAGVSNVASDYFPSPFSDYSYRVTVHCVQAANLDTSVDPIVTEYKNVEVKVTKVNQAPVIINSLLTNHIN